MPSFSCSEAHTDHPDILQGWSIGRPTIFFCLTNTRHYRKQLLIFFSSVLLLLTDTLRDHWTIGPLCTGRSLTIPQSVTVYEVQPWSRTMIQLICQQQTWNFWNLIKWWCGWEVAQSPNATHYLVGRSSMTPKVARWATQLSISGDMIKQKTCKFCVNNSKTHAFQR